MLRFMLRQVSVDEELTKQRIWLQPDFHRFWRTVDEGGNLEGWVDYFAAGADQDNLDELTRGSLFPGGIEFQVNNRNIRVVCDDPEMNFLDTQVFMDGLEITDDVARVYASIDAINDNVSIWFKYKTGEQFGIAEFENVVLI